MGELIRLFCLAVVIGVALAPLIPVGPGAGLWIDAWRRLKKNPTAMIGLYIVLSLAGVACVSDWVAPHSPSSQDYEALSRRNEIIVQYQKGEYTGSLFLADVSVDHPLGVDHLGRDIFSRLLFGSVISLEVAVISQGVAVLIGLVLGLLAGYYGGWLDMTLMAFTEVILAFPFLLLVMVIVAVFGVPSLNVIFVIIGLVGWPAIARVVRAQVLSLKQKEFVEAAHALGARDGRILFQHLTPNIMAPIIVQVSLGMAGAILSEAGLSFLGFGAQEPIPSWGLMVAKGQSIINPLWWLSVFPGLAVMLAVFGFNLLGDGLRDALDPRMKT